MSSGKVRTAAFEARLTATRGAAVMADREDWDLATRSQRHLAVAADTELRRRHPGQPFPPLRSAEPEPATDTQRTEPAHTLSEPPGEIGQLISDLAAAHRTFTERLADRQSLMIPAEDPPTVTSARRSRRGPGQKGMRSCSRRSRRSTVASGPGPGS